MVLKNNIKLKIIEKEYKSVQDFSFKNNLSYYKVRKLANNETNSIDIELLVSLCEIFKCNVGDLLYIDKAA